MAIQNIADITNMEVRVWFEGLRKKLEECAQAHDFAAISWVFAQCGAGPRCLAEEAVREGEEHIRQFPILQEVAEEELALLRYLADNIEELNALAVRLLEQYGVRNGVRDYLRRFGMKIFSPEHWIPWWDWAAKTL
jgi:hypothetical protein